MGELSSEVPQEGDEDHVVERRSQAESFQGEARNYASDAWLTRVLLLCGTERPKGENGGSVQRKGGCGVASMTISASV